MANEKELGTCPLCGGKLMQNDFKVYCENGHWNRDTRSVDGCPFQFFLSVGPSNHRTPLSEQDVEDIVTRGKTSRMLTLNKKDGSGTYQCYLRWDNDENRLVFDFGR